MTVLIILLAGFGVGLIALAVLVVELTGHVRRFQRAASTARGDLVPQITDLQSSIRRESSGTETATSTA